MNPSAPSTLRALIIVAGFALQGAWAVRDAPHANATRGVLLGFFLVLAVAGWVWRRGLRGGLLASASLGGFGMLAGRFLDGTEAMHCESMSASSMLWSWSGALMLCGCTLACWWVTASGRGAQAASSATIGSFGVRIAALSFMLIGMVAGMVAPLWLAERGWVTPAWALHPAMLIGMTLGGLATATVSSRTLRAARGKFWAASGLLPVAALRQKQKRGV